MGLGIITSFITKHYKPIIFGIVAALFYTSIVGSYSSTSFNKGKENENDNNKGGLPIVLQQARLQGMRKTRSQQKDTRQNAAKQDRLDQVQSKFSSDDVTNGQKKIASTKRGWSYKGPGQWRCKVQTVGCFSPAPANMSKSFILLVDSSSEMTDSRCILHCSKKLKLKFIFAGLRNGNECRCSEKPYYLIESTQYMNKCNLPCSGDKSRKCGGRRGLTMLYMIKSKCVADTGLDHVLDESSIIGCYHKPHYLPLIMERYAIENDRKPARCILQCEAVGLVLAIPMEPNVCFCGLTSARFTLSNPVNMTNCSPGNDNHIMVHRTNSEDKRCGQKRFLKSGELHRKVGLITFPGSGNTWLRHLIESATGIYSGSVYGDPALVNGGYLGELLPPESHKVAVVKSHHQTQIREMRYLNAIINVYRNPYEAILSEYNRRGKGHVGTIDKKTFDVKGLTDLANGPYSRKWRMTTKTVLELDMPTLVFSYEELVKNTIPYAEKMARFILGNSIDDNELQGRLSCMYLESMGVFKRKKKHYDFDPFSRTAKMAINGEIVELDKDLTKYHKAPVLQFVRPIDEG